MFAKIYSVTTLSEVYIFFSELSLSLSLSSSHITFTSALTLTRDTKFIPNSRRQNVLIVSVLYGRWETKFLHSILEKIAHV